MLTSGGISPKIRSSKGINILTAKIPPSPKSKACGSVIKLPIDKR